MTRKRILAVVMLVATIIMAYGIINLPPPRVEDKNLNAELKAYNTITVTVKRASGSTETYVKKGDPWLRNFVALIANAFLGRAYSTPVAIYRTDGSTFTIPEWEYIYSGGTQIGKNPYLKIGIGSSNTEVTFFDYELGNLIATADVTSANAVVSDNGTSVNMQFTASFSFSDSYTIREVGLYWYGYAFGSATQFSVLLARDVIGPISVGSGDAMSVTYLVSIPYSTPPIVKNFVALICNYIFGLKYYGKAISYVTTDGTSTTVMDIGHDYASSGADNINEKASIHIGQGDPIYRKDLSNIYSYVASSQLGLYVGIGYNSTHAWYTFSPTAVVTVASGAVIREVGFIIDSTDIDGASGNSAKKVLMMYFPLQNPINVPAGSGIKFNFVLYLPLAPAS